jgi:hypothetical protein
VVDAVETVGTTVVWTVNVSERVVAALLVDSGTPDTELTEGVTVFVASAPSEAVETMLPVVAVETVTGTEVYSVVNGLSVN